MKSIYEFKVNKKVKKQIEEITDAGKLVKEIEEEIPVKIIFKRPNRPESEEADSVSAIEYSESIRKGILTKPLLEKLYDEKGGFLAENYESKYGKLLAQFFELENEYRRLDFKENKTAEDKTKISETAAQFINIQRELQGIESARNNLFQNTAETRAQNKTILWLTLFLTYIQEDESKEPIPFFESKSKDYVEAFKEKRDDYDKKIEEDQDFYYRVIDKMAFFVSLWYMGKASKEEDFKRIEDNLNPVSESVEEIIESPKEEPIVNSDK